MSSLPPSTFFVEDRGGSGILISMDRVTLVLDPNATAELKSFINQESSLRFYATNSEDQSQLIQQLAAYKILDAEFSRKNMKSILTLRAAKTLLRLMRRAGRSNNPRVYRWSLWWTGVIAFALCRLESWSEAIDLFQRSISARKPSQEAFQLSRLKRRTLRVYSQHYLPLTCKEHSLMLAWFLAIHEVPCSIVVGVRRYPMALHAWVETGESDPQNTQYQVVVNYAF